MNVKPPLPRPTDAEQTRPEASDRFLRKRELILDAAAQVINERGLKGLTFVAVAEAVGLNTTSVTYYFRRKELLAAAAMEHSMRLLEQMVDEAATWPTPRERVKSFAKSWLQNAGNARLSRIRPSALLSDMRALDEPMRAELGVAYRAFFRKIVGFFDGATREDLALNHARAHVLLDTLYWARAWLPKYSVGDYERVGRRIADFYEGGLFPEGAKPGPLIIAAPEDERGPDISRETFIAAATRLINERGYRGASVERIAAELNVSKGSFYHHLDGKDGLVLDCFERSYGRVSRIQRRVLEGPGSYRDRMVTAIASLLAAQFGTDFPLLRITALQALPAEMRGAMIERSDRMAMRFAGMIADGITEGSIRPVDPMIAGQSVMGVINAASDMRHWAQARNSVDEAVRLYLHPLTHGLYTPL